MVIFFTLLLKSPLSFTLKPFFFFKDPCFVIYNNMHLTETFPCPCLVSQGARVLSRERNM